MAGLIGTARAKGYGVDVMGLSEQTGVWIEGTAATVVGEGAVTLLSPADDWTCTEGAPPTMQRARLDRLTDGWSWSTIDGALLPADGAEAVAWDGVSGTTEGEWYADGDWLPHEERFAWVAERDPDPYGTHAGTDLPVLADSVGILDAHEDERRGVNEETIFRALYDHIGATGFLVPTGTSLVAEAELVAAIDNPESGDAPGSVIVIDTSTVTWRGLSPSASNADIGDTSLHAAALTGLTLHLLYTPTDDRTYNPVDHVLGGP